MKDEIKEILKLIGNAYYYGNITYEEEQKYCNYITNLQEEVKSANESITWWTNRFNALRKENKRLKEENRDLSRMCELYSKSLYNAELTDYKSRNEKAIECIKILGIDIDTPDEDLLIRQVLKQLLSILLGEDKDVKD